MNYTFATIICIAIVQVTLTIAMFNLKSWIMRMINVLKQSYILGEPNLDAKIAAVVLQLKESKDAQEIYNNQSSAEVVKQVTNALEVLTGARDKNVKIIISNDRINQGGFEIKLSYRLDDLR